MWSGTLTQLPQVRKWSGKETTFPKVREKSRNFYHFKSVKIDSLKKRQGKLNYFHTADLIPSRVGWNIWGHCNLNYIFPTSWMGRKNACKLRPEAATRSDILSLSGHGNINFILRERFVRKFWNVRPVATMIADHCKMYIQFKSLELCQVFCNIKWIHTEYLIQGKSLTWLVLKWNGKFIFAAEGLVIICESIDQNKLYFHHPDIRSLIQ